MIEEKPLVLEMLQDMKNYYQMPAFWSDKEKNSDIEIGYCPTCDQIKDITKTRRTYGGADCLGDHWSSTSVPLQCFDSRHEGAIEFNSNEVDYFLRSITFFQENKKLLEDFELKNNRISESLLSKIEVGSSSYELFRVLINKWKKEEIDRMHNPTYINTYEFSKLVQNYEKWNSMSWDNQISDIESLHKSR